MKSINKVMLIGHATRDPELKSTQNGHSICTFGLATSRVWKDAGGAKQTLPEFHNLVAWDRLAEFCEQYIKKGKPLYIEGRLQTRSWDGADGKKNVRTEVIVEDIVLLAASVEVE
jgi:single-strand DNA-binding protein